MEFSHYNNAYFHWRVKTRTSGRCKVFGRNSPKTLHLNKAI